jgi:putative transposase
MPTAPKGFGALRKGRYSSPEADYFITICLQRPSAALTDVFVSERCWNEIKHLETTGALTLRCAVIMPDHLHLLITLGHAMGLSSVIRLLKGRMASTLRRHLAAWQPGFYDHRFQPGDDLLPVFLYIFLNPYRKNLISPDQIWCGYSCSPSDWVWFKTLTRESRPEPTWLS